MKVTDWYSHITPPELVGNYDYKYDENDWIFNAYFDGEIFIIKDGSFFDGEKVQKPGAWRGLAEKPKAKS